MINAGKLTYTVYIQRKSGTIDDYGTVADVWTDVATLRAERVSNDAAEVIRDNSREADETTIKFRTRFATVLQSDRLIFETKPFDIISVKELGRKRGLEITAISRGNLPPVIVTAIMELVTDDGITLDWN